MCEHNALGYRSSMALYLTKVKSSPALCPDTALIFVVVVSPTQFKKVTFALENCVQSIQI